MKMEREETHMASANGSGHLRGSLAKKEIETLKRTLALPGAWSSSPPIHRERRKFPALSKWQILYSKYVSRGRKITGRISKRKMHQLKDAGRRRWSKKQPYRRKG